MGSESVTVKSVKQFCIVARYNTARFKLLSPRMAWEQGRGGESTMAKNSGLRNK